MTRALPNLLTALRIPLSLALLFVTPLGSTYLLLYALAGVTDMLDGLLARRLHAESTFGSRLDTVADMTMIAAAGITLWPFLPLNGATIACIAGIALPKMASLLVCAIRWRKLLSHHSVMNKVVGFAFFICPPDADLAYDSDGCAALCGVGCGFGGIMGGDGRELQAQRFYMNRR